MTRLEKGEGHKAGRGARPCTCGQRENGRGDEGTRDEWTKGQRTNGRGGTKKTGFIEQQGAETRVKARGTRQRGGEWSRPKQSEGKRRRGERRAKRWKRIRAPLENGERGIEARLSGGKAGRVNAERKGGGDGGERTRQGGETERVEVERNEKKEVRKRSIDETERGENGTGRKLSGATVPPY